MRANLRRRRASSPVLSNIRSSGTSAAILLDRAPSMWYRARSRDKLSRVVIACPIMHDIRLHKYHYRTGSGYASNSLVRNFDQGWSGNFRTSDRNLLSRPSFSVFFFQVHRFLVADRNLRRFLNLNSYCGVVTIAVFIFTVIVTLCSIAVSFDVRQIGILHLEFLPLLRLSLGIVLQARNLTCDAISFLFPYTVYVRTWNRSTDRMDDWQREN